MLAQRLSGILPPLSFDEALETTMVYSTAGLLGGSSLVAARPFRAPHHTVSAAGLVGGGPTVRPGEVSLAHNGVLFLDELLEFPRSVLEALRQPMEDGRVGISRAQVSVGFPARFALIAAMNPCPCCHLGHPTKVCVCSHAEILKYRSRLSGALADRMDRHVALAPVETAILDDVVATSESSQAIRCRVERARAAQRCRFESRSNATASRRELLSSGLTAEARRVLRAASESLQLSAR